MKLNECKCCLLIAGHGHESIWVKTGKAKFLEYNRQKTIRCISR